MKAKPSVNIDHFTGIDERTDSIRISFGSDENGRVRKMSFIDAANLDIDNSGMVTLQRGHNLSLPGNYRDLWSNESICLFNDNGTLKSLSKDLKHVSVILSGLDPTAPIAYVDVNGYVYLTNGSIVGYIRSGSFTALSDPNITFKSVMPAGHLIDFFDSRLYVARDNVIFFSDPATCQYYDKRYGFHQMAGRITLMRSIQDGFYLSDSEFTYFSAGYSPKDASLIKVAEYPANENSAVLVDSENIGIGGLSGKVLIWSSPKGICLGSPGGRFINLTHEKFQLYKSSENAAICIMLPGKTQYLFLSEIQEASIEANPFEITTSMTASL